MAKIKILGDACTIISDVTTEQLKTLKKFKPQTLKLIDPETKEITFAADIGPGVSVSKYGIVFNSKNNEDKAQVTVNLPTGMDNAAKKDYVRDNFGYTLLNLNTLERQITAVLEETAEEFTEIGNSIEIL